MYAATTIRIIKKKENNLGIMRIILKPNKLNDNQKGSGINYELIQEIDNDILKRINKEPNGWGSYAELDLI